MGENAFLYPCGPSESQGLSDGLFMFFLKMQRIVSIIGKIVQISAKR